MILLRKAVLIVHGFAGGTYDEEPLAHQLESNWEFDVYSYTLPGHVKREFKKVAFEEWIDASEAMIQKLIQYGYRKVYVIGHSMGGIIATYLANKYPQVKKLVLVAPAFEYFKSDEDNTIDKVKNSLKMLKENDTSDVINRLLKLPVSSLKEFDNLREKYKDEYLNIKVPTLFLQGNNDTVVPMNKAKKVYEKINVKNKQFVLLKGYTHDVFSNDGQKAILEIEKFLK